MYELTCPCCRQVMHASFVRVGAAAVCAACKQRFLIDQAHFRRTSPPAPAPGSDPAASSAAQPGQALPDAPPVNAATRGDETGHVVGLSGLSDMMRREAAAAQRLTSAPAAATNTTAARSPIKSPAIEQHHRSTWLLLLLLLGVILTIFISGILVSVNLDRTEPPATMNTLRTTTPAP